MNESTVEDQAIQPDQLELQLLRGRARAFERAGMLERATLHSDIEAIQFPDQARCNAVSAKARKLEARAEQPGVKQEAAQAKEEVQAASPVVEVGGVDAVMASTPATARGNDLYWFPRYV